MLGRRGQFEGVADWLPVLPLCLQLNWSLLKIVGGTPVPAVGYALASLGHSLARVKFELVAAPPKGQNMVFRKKLIWVGHRVLVVRCC